MTAPSTEGPVGLDLPPSLEYRYRFLSALGELLSIAGLAASAVLLTVSIGSGGKMSHPWLLWTGGAMLGVAFLLMVVVQTHLGGNAPAKSFLQTYKQWSPAWMRWSLQLSGAVFGVAVFLSRLHIDLPASAQQWMKGQTPHMPYVIGCWGFLLCAAFHTAIQRSQEQLGPLNSGA
jgi:hypothetical protein